MILDLILIRHAQSCGNIWKAKSKFRQITYKDPEITEAGIKTSKRLSGVLGKKLKEAWGEQPYSVGSSQMIRAQETAYYMTDRPINISPYVGEDGMTLDNYSLSKDAQRKIMGERNPKILAVLDKGIDSREKQTLSDKSSWSTFIKWAEKYPESFSKGSDSIYRAVIFTHSHFLMKALGLSKVDKLKNNNGYRIIIRNGTISNTKRLDIGDTVDNGEPDKCRISPYNKISNTKKVHKNTKKCLTKKQKACKTFMNNYDLLTNYNQRTYKEHLQDLISYSQL
jgi:broad specificity phosphatase PhoE